METNEMRFEGGKAHQLSPSGDLTELIHVRVTEDMARRIDNFGLTDGRDRSNAVRYLLNKMLEMLRY